MPFALFLFLPSMSADSDSLVHPHMPQCHCAGRQEHKAAGCKACDPSEVMTMVYLGTTREDFEKTGCIYTGEKKKGNVYGPFYCHINSPRTRIKCNNTESWDFFQAYTTFFLLHMCGNTMAFVLFRCILCHTIF